MRTPRAPVVAMLLVAVGCTRTDPAAITSVGGDAGPPSPTPVVTVPLRVVAVAVGGFTSYALMNDGSVRAWGDGGYGALGDPALELALANHALRPGGEAHVLLARAHLKAGQPAEALAVAERALATPYRTAGLHDVAAKAHAALGHKAESEAQISLCYAINPYFMGDDHSH